MGSAKTARACTGCLAEIRDTLCQCYWPCGGSAFESITRLSYLIVHFVKIDTLFGIWGTRMSRIFGDLIQLGYVVTDIECSMRHWAETLGVGPWFYIEHLQVPDFTYRGRPSPVELSLALANSGAMQVELIQQRNNAPSAYRDFLRGNIEGQQHLGYGTYDFATTLLVALASGYAVEQQGTGGSRGPFAYLYTDTAFAKEFPFTHEGVQPGTMVELIDLAHGRAELFAGIAAAARDWDGCDAIRTTLPV